MQNWEKEYLDLCQGLVKQEGRDRLEVIESFKRLVEKISVDEVENQLNRLAFGEGQVCMFSSNKV